MSDGVFRHRLAECESTNIGEGTRLWAFSHVLPGAAIGIDCNICDHVFIENDVVVGDRVTVKSGVQLWDGLRIADDVFIGPNATFTNDRFPRSKQYPEAYLETRVEQGASLGANCTVLPGLTIGAGAMVAAGAVVVRDVPPRTVVAGNPAVIIRHLDKNDELSPAVRRIAFGESPAASAVEGVAPMHFPVSRDMRGKLAALEFSSDTPFVPQRAFLVHNVPSTEVRGAHAHHTCEQLLIGASGSISVIVDDGTSREEYVLDDPGWGLYIPPMVWAVQHRFSPSAVLLVLASLPYDSADYIRNYDDFLALVRG